MKKVTTTCPSCGTSFRVTPQQLAARQGQVRCGHCNTLFNGLETLAMADKTPPNPAIGQPIVTALPAAPPPSQTGDAMHDTTAQPSEDSSGTPVLYHPDFSPTSGANNLFWLAGSGLLLLLLLAQGMIYFRDSIARDLPSFKPILSTFCDVIGCQIELPRNADLITIEASDLKQFPERPNEIIVAAVLRNRAAYSQAYPTLELTLTDAADQALVTRLIAPADYLGDAARIAQGMAPSQEVTLRLRLESKDLVAVGYRLYVFFP